MGCTNLTLLCLWSVIVVVTPLTYTQVHRATEYIKNTFKLAGAKQHAFVTVFTEQECESLSSNYNNLQILQNENASEIIEALNNDKKIYKGNQMVLATYKSKEKKWEHHIHSEYRLLNPSPGSDVSPIQKLLNRNSGAACVVFYTLNSPCVGVCTNKRNPNNIITKLETVFHKFNNNKAFVYNKLYSRDLKSTKTTKEDIWAGLMEINNKMDVYRCFPRTCIKCFEMGKNKRRNKDHCLK